MKALTLKHPWAFCIAHWGKRIENRSWKPWKEVIGQRIAIHGGEIPKGKALRDAEFIVGQLRKQFGIPACVGNDQLHMMRLRSMATKEASGIVAAAIIDRWVKFGSDDIAEQDPWFDNAPGNVGWVLRDVVTLETPVPCKGVQWLWNVPDEVLAQVLNQH